VTYRDNLTVALSDLQPHEQQLFGVLARLLLHSGESGDRADRRLIDDVAERLGADAFWSCLEEAAGPQPDEPALAELTRNVARTESRSFIYASLSELAMAGSMGDKQLALLDWLAEIWHIAQRPIDGPYR